LNIASQVDLYSIRKYFFCGGDGVVDISLGMGGG
jgi:hypothetical protein